MLVFATIVSCDNKDNGASNASKYAEESTFSKMEGVKSIEVTAIDSVLTDEMMDESSFIALADKVTAGTVPEERLRETADSLHEIGRDIYLTWNGGDRKDAVRAKYPGRWRILYTITATLESGAKKSIRVMMKEDGVTPDMTEDEFKQQEQKKSGVIRIMTGDYNWNY